MDASARRLARYYSRAFVHSWISFINGSGSDKTGHMATQQSFLPSGAFSMVDQMRDGNNAVCKKESIQHCNIHGRGVNTSIAEANAARSPNQQHVVGMLEFIDLQLANLKVHFCHRNGAQVIIFLSLFELNEMQLCNLCQGRI